MDAWAVAFVLAMVACFLAGQRWYLLSGECRRLRSINRGLVYEASKHQMWTMEIYGHAGLWQDYRNWKAARGEWPAT